MKQILFFLSLLLFTCHLYAQVDPTDQKISVLLGHRYSGGFDPHGYEQYSYTGVFKIDGKYYLKPTKIRVHATTDPCSRDSIFSTQALESGECLYLFWNLGQYKNEAIETHYIAPDYRFIYPGKNYIFTFNKQQYSFTATGVVNLKDNSIDNYRLILINETKRMTQVLVAEDSLNESIVEILFIGDLDGDKNPDFIINAPPYKETRNILLFLSSHTKNKNAMVHRVSEQFDWFDCE